MTHNNQIIRQWNGRTIRQRPDGYLSATDMCNACGKRFHNWHRTNSAQEYLKALCNKRYSDMSNGNLIEVIQGGIPELQGTWVYRKVGLRLAQWLSPDFAIQVDEWTEELLLNGSVNLLSSSVITPAQLAINNAESVIGWISGLGIDETLAKQMKIDMVAKQLPQYKETFEQAKKAIAAADPMPSVGMTPTELGQLLNPPLKASQVNQLLEKLGLQFKATRISTKTGKPKFFWQVTDNGQRHSVVFKVTSGKTDWNGSQIKWHYSALSLLQRLLVS